MRTPVAITLVESGMSLAGVKRALNVDADMEMLGSALDGREGFLWYSSLKKRFPSTGAF